MSTIFRPLLVACSLLFAASSPDAREQVSSIQEAIEDVQRETGGRVLSADIVRAGPRELYRIKVLTPDGRVRVVTKSSRGGSRR